MGNSSKKKWMGISISLVVVALAYGYYATKHSGSSSAGMEVPLASDPKPAPDFQLSDGKGAKHSLSEFKGKTIILHFWATWCPPCIEELPQFLEGARKNSDPSIHWVAISLDKSWDEAHKLLSEDQVPKNVTSLLDNELKVPDLYGSFQFPESYLIAPDFKILTKWVGTQEWNTPAFTDFMNKVREVLKKKSGA